VLTSVQFYRYEHKLTACALGEPSLTLVRNDSQFGLLISSGAHEDSFTARFYLDDVSYLRVSGNTDNVGSRDANVRLSRVRAEAVAQYLMTKGFERNKFDVVGNGPDKPVAGNDSDGGRAKNRRTDFEVIAR
jgi:hypothetical protein